jgi:type II secretory pathway component PulC
MLKGLDNKKKIELTITGIGIIILIFLIANHMPKSKDNKSVSKAEPYPTLEVGFEVTNNEQRTTNDEHWGRDPFLLDTSNVKEQGMEDLVLNGIVSDRENQYAIINNDVVKLGDKVNGMTVIEINENNVVLDENGQRHTLELNPY